MYYSIPTSSQKAALWFPGIPCTDISHVAKDGQPAVEPIDTAAGQYRCQHAAKEIVIDAGTYNYAIVHSNRAFENMHGGVQMHPANTTSREMPASFRRWQESLDPVDVVDPADGPLESPDPQEARERLFEEYHENMHKKPRKSKQRVGQTGDEEAKFHNPEPGASRAGKGGENLQG